MSATTLNEDERTQSNGKKENGQNDNLDTCEQVPLNITKLQGVEQIANDAPITRAHIALGYHINYLPCKAEEVFKGSKISDKPHKCENNPNCHIYFHQLWRSTLNQAFAEVFIVIFIVYRLLIL